MPARVTVNGAIGCTWYQLFLLPMSHFRIGQIRNVAGGRLRTATSSAGSHNNFAAYRRERGRGGYPVSTCAQFCSDSNERNRSNRPNIDTSLSSGQPSSSSGSGDKKIKGVLRTSSVSPNIATSPTQQAAATSSTASASAAATIANRKRYVLDELWDSHTSGNHKTSSWRPSGNEAATATKVGAMGNTALAASKGVIGLWVGSTALIADAVNNLSDLLCDAVVWYTVTEARKASTPDKPWGRGKLEPMGALGVSALLLGTGAGIGTSACVATLPYVWPYLPHDSTSELVQSILATMNKYMMPSDIAVGLEAIAGHDWYVHAAAVSITVVSMFGKEALFRYSLKVGERAKSAAVIANAWQHRADVYVSSAVLIGLLGSAVGYPMMDPLAGVIVSGYIAKHAISTGKEALNDLGDVPADPEETQLLRMTCLSVPGILSVESLLARKSGPYLYVEVAAGVSGTISASAAHRLSELVRFALLERHHGRVANAVVDITPLGSAGMGQASPSWARDHDHICKEVERAVLALPDITSVSEVQVYYKDDGRIAIKVDVCMNPELTIRNAHALAVKARCEVENVFPHVAEVDIDLELEEF